MKKRTRPWAREKKEKPEGEAKKKGIGTMNLILIIVGVSLLAFTVAMIRLFTVYGAIPDTLCSCVFATLGGECGVMGWIQTTKTKKQEREWAEADRKTDQEAEPSADQGVLQEFVPDSTEEKI